jgi:hypothetical protein
VHEWLLKQIAMDTMGRLASSTRLVRHHPKPFQENRWEESLEQKRAVPGCVISSRACSFSSAPQNNTGR